MVLRTPARSVGRGLALCFLGSCDWSRQGCCLQTPPSFTFSFVVNERDAQPKQQNKWCGSIWFMVRLSFWSLPLITSLRRLTWQYCIAAFFRRTNCWPFSIELIRELCYTNLIILTMEWTHRTSVWLWSSWLYRAFAHSLLWLNGRADHS